MRIGGLASGMDIDSLVKDLMKAERTPLNKLLQKKQTLEWQRDDYRAMNTLLLDFRSELTQMKLTSKYRARATTSTDDTRLTATATGAASQSSVTVSKVTQLASSERMLNSGGVDMAADKSLFSQTDSNAMWKQGVVEFKTLTADGTSEQIALNVSSANTLDTESWSVSVNGKSYRVVTDSSKLDDTSVYIDSDNNLNFSSVIAKDSAVKVDYIAKDKTDSLKLSHNTTTLQLSRGSIDTISSIQLTGITNNPIELKVVGNEIKDTDDTVLGTIDKNSGKVTFSQEGLVTMKSKGYLPPEKPEEGKDYDYKLEIKYDQNYTNFSIDTVTSKGKVHKNFLIQGNETISTLTSKVNGSNAGVSMFYDTFTKQMSLTRTETGKFNVDSTGKSLGYDIATNGTLIDEIFKFKTTEPDGKVTQNVTEGTNAKFEINGITTERNSNTFTMEGVTFTLKQTFGEGTADPTASPVSINVNNNSTEVFDNIVQFVNKYNEMIDTINKKIGETRYRDYQPLSDEEREAMSDKQQEMWDDKAKSGLLRRDPILSGALTEMRMDFYQGVSNDKVNPLYNQLAKLGIETSSNYLEGGKLIINETKLKAAIESDPESVENFFRGEGTTEGQKGVINRLYDTATSVMDKLKVKAGNNFSTSKQYSMGRELDEIGDRITRFEDRLKQVEDRYWSQFTAMEKAIQRANEQSAYLMQQFSGM
ncbi:flagellar filament capping protein FliD [Bacillus infantis]|uniref:flagellar filament capping protein FliD n=1 Tax=Bacillus infantis TaxID=324767 RepID=UPI002005A0FC|nr:flagellar filament capping protein FliD [Bacillus infantis]MCK6206012.1 flagellar filament capping protein FliD [Bacillus infantis]